MEYFYNRLNFSSKFLQEEAHYGIVRFNSSPVTGTVYFLHGGTGDDRLMKDSGALDRVGKDLLSRLSARNLQLALPYIGKSFLRECRRAGEPDFARYFVEEVIPTIEKGTDTTAASRWVGGLSMGGMAALSLFFRKPDLFRGVGVHAPTLVDFDFLSDAAAASYAAKYDVSDCFLALLLSDLRTQFDTPDYFRAHDPLALARALPMGALSGKTICVNVGSDDEFGLQAGAKVLHGILTERRIAHHFEVVQGAKHDMTYVSAQFPSLVGRLLGL